MLNFKVDGMSCEHCVREVKSLVLEIPGVETANVDLTSGRLQILGHIDPIKIITAVGEEGYTVSEI